MPDTQFEERVRSALGEHADDQPFDPYSVRPTAKRARRRLERRAIVAGALVVIALAALIQTGIPFEDTSNPATPPVPLGNEVITFVEGGVVKSIHADGSDETTIASPCSMRTCYVGGISWSPTGAGLAFATASPNGRGGGLFVAAAGETGFHQLRGCPAGAPTWSPDGSRIATVTRSELWAGGRVYTCAAQGGDVKRMSFDAGWGSPVAWSPDGHELAYILAFKSLGDFVVVEAADGTDTTAIARVSGGPGCKAVAWSPDGSRIAFTTCHSPSQGQQGPTRLWVINADGSDPHVVLTGRWMGSPAWSPDGSTLSIVRSHPKNGSGSLIVMAADGMGGGTVLVSGRLTQFASWDPSGAALALFRNDDLVVVPLNGSPVETVAPSIHNPGYGTLVWQPPAS